MESRANYATIGLFVLAVIAIGAAFLWWLTGAGSQSSQLNVRVIFTGAVTGLTTGSAVQFNGIKVGEVAELSLDQEDPNTVIAIIRVDRNKPIRTDTRAILSYQGLTGVANLQLEGGSRNAPLLFDAAEGAGGMPTIHAEVSPFQDILETARNVLVRADNAMAAIDDVVSDNGPAINRTIANVETFSRALAQNADGVDEALASVSRAAAAVGDISETLKGTASRAEALLNAVEPAQVTALVDNLARASADLGDVVARAKVIADGIDPAVVNAAVQNVADAASVLRETLARADSIVQAVDPAEVDRLVSSLMQASDDIGATARRADGILAAVDPDKLRTIVDDVAGAAGDIGSVVETARATMDRVGAVVGAVDPATVRGAVDDLAEFSAVLGDSRPQVESILADVQSASGSLKGLGETIDARRGDIDTIIADARTLAGQLNGIAARADGVLQKIDGYVEGDGEGLVAEATATLESIRTVAATLEQRIGPITANVEAFTDRGLDSFVRLADEGRRALSRLDRVLSGIERDPQQFIFGGQGVPEYNPRRR
jgi:phospholipid/cholesterol/gamma-HCH transport system substrate-binding protein